MMFNWETEKEKVLKGAKIAPKKKLESIRLLNELADKALTQEQKLMRQKLKKTTSFRIK